MKKHYKIFCANFLAIAISILIVKGQSPVLTSTNSSPVPGSTFTCFLTTLPPLFSTVQLTGANQTWDFSSSVGVGTLTYQCLAPAATPFGNSFPTATVALYDSFFDTYSYFRGTANDFSQQGQVIFNYVSAFSDPYKYFSYPFTYQNSFIDTLLNDVDTTYITHTADGYGTLIMPYGSISNVLRHHEHWVNYAPSGVTHEDRYSWSLPDTRFLYLCFYMIRGHSDGTIDTVYNYINPTGTTAVNELNRTNATITCFPNPFSKQLTFNLAYYEQATILLYDLLGQRVLQQTFTNSTTISTEQLAKGIYFYELRNGKEVVKTGKILKD
jgi:hypothetical protein